MFLRPQGVPDSVSITSRRLSAPKAQLLVLALALVLAMSPWFSTAAVLADLRSSWGLSQTAASWLTITVQLGFVAGAVVSAYARLADRISPYRLILLGALGAASANVLIVLADNFSVALVARFLTGAFLAGVYPPALKAMSSWYQKGRGLALGVLIGALTIGSALPHLINATGGAAWKPTLLVVSLLTVAGGALAEVAGKPGPFAITATRIDPSQLRNILANREFRLASLGYFGHMWELYAMWAWIAAFFGEVFSSARSASGAAFAVIAVGSAGSVHAGLLSDRRTRTEAARLAMRWSTLGAVTTGFLIDLHPAIPLTAALVWGFWVVADSAQFSTIVTEVIDPALVGTALTLQLAAGFILTVFTIFLVPVVRDAAGWGAAFMLLAPGPVVGAWAMSALHKSALDRSSVDRNALRKPS